MTVLTACSDAAIELIGKPLTAAFSSSGKFERELQRHANKMARAIAKAHDWQALTTLETVTGDGAAISHALPDDYDRMPVSASLNSTTWRNYRYTPARDLNQWHDIQTFASVGTPGFWIMLGGTMNVYPVMPLSETATYYYLSKNWALGDDTVAKAAFTADTDTFRLSEDLLTLGIIWSWRQQKRLEYSEDMASYEVELSQLRGRDRGSRIIAVGSRWRGSGIDSGVYPGALGPGGGGDLPPITMDNDT